jgi:1-acyl-sn-glycerol-3-phosphate acyltransferase
VTPELSYLWIDFFSDSVPKRFMKKIDDLVTILDGILKVTAFLALVLVLIPVTVAFKYIDPRHPFKIPLFFHRVLLRLLGIRVRVFGVPSEAAPVLFVSNHASYLDILVLGSLLPAGFVAKAEVADWPLFGVLSKLQNSVFIERRSTRAVEQSSQLQNYLARGQNLILFPEGTSSDGLTALPFKSALFSIVEDSARGKDITVQPVSVTCVELDDFPMLREERAQYAWYGDMIMIPHLWNVFQNGHFTVEVIFHAPLASTDYPNRKNLAAACQEIVTKGIKESLTRKKA